VRFSYKQDGDEQKSSVKFLFFNIGKKKGKKEKKVKEKKEEIIKFEKELEKEILEDININHPEDEKTPQPIGRFDIFKEKLASIKEKYDFYANHPHRAVIKDMAVDFIKREFRALKPRYLSVSGRVGLGEPDTTGMAIAAVCALNGMTGLKLLIDGDFTGQSVSLRVKAADRVSIFSVLYPALRFALRKPVRPLLFGMVFKGRKDKKRVKEDKNVNIVE
jgi:hypothetical protein